MSLRTFFLSRVLVARVGAAIVAVVSSLAMSLPAVANTTVTFISSALDKKVERPYDERIVALALNASLEKYGPFTLERAPQMSRKRAVASIVRNKYPNSVRLLFPRFVDPATSLQSIRFPVYLGALSHRVCFINGKNRMRFSGITSVKQLEPFTFGMGMGWADADVLRSNNLNVTFFQGYASIFKMLEAERIDLFCRGLHEVKQEVEAFKFLPNVELAETFSINYPMIVTFYTNKKNKKLVERLEYGFYKAFDEGKVQALWEEEFGEAVKYVNFQNRTHLFLDSQLNNYVNFNYLKFFNHNIFPEKPADFLKD